MIDGAVLVNLPAQSTVEAIIRQPSRERIERVLALVVPDPGELITADEGEPTLNEVLVKSIVGIPRTQSLTDFVRDLNEHNSEVRSRRAARRRDARPVRRAWTQPDAWNELRQRGRRALSPPTAPPGSRAHSTGSASGCPALLPAGAPPIDLPRSTPSTPDVVPWVANVLALGGTEWCWGSAPVRRMAAVLITWINTVAAAATPDDRRRACTRSKDASEPGPRRGGPASRRARACFETLFVEELRARRRLGRGRVRTGEPPLADRRRGRRGSGHHCA